LSTYEAEADQPFEQFLERIETCPVFGAFVEGTIIGMVGFWRETSPKERHKGFIWGMYVAPAARRLGIGVSLVQAVVEHAATQVEQVRLAVNAGNQAAIALYERQGFVIYGREPRALKGPNGYSDDILMVRFLAD